MPFKFNPFTGTFDLVNDEPTSSGLGGDTGQITETAHGFSVLDAVYFDGTNWLQAQANADDTVADYVVYQVDDANNFRAAKLGTVTAAAHGLTVGQHYFLSDTVAGGATLTSPARSNPLFQILDANTVLLSVMRPVFT